MGMHEIVAPDDRRAFKHRMCADATACTNHDLSADHRIWTDLHVIGQVGAGIDQGGGMNA
jgi:hypothetical protein